MLCRRLPFVLLLLTPCVANAQAPQPQTYVIQNVSVLPMTGAPTRLADVVVQERRVVRIVPPGDAAPPPAAVVIDGRGKFLIPGLIDAHVHIKEGDPLFLFVANGVTTVQNMAGRPFHLALRDSVARGLLLGPRILSAGPTTAQAGVESPEQAESLVAEQKQLGYNVIKMYGGRGGAMSLETYRRLLETSRRSGMRVVGHAPRNLPFQVVLDERQPSIDHMEEIVYTHEPFARLLRPYVDVQFDRASDAIRDSLARLPVPDFAMELRSEIEVLATDVQRSGIAITPNIVFFRNIHWMTTDSIHALLRAPELAYANPALRLNWSPFLNNYRNSWGDNLPLMSQYLGMVTRLEEAVTAAFHNAGVPIMAGTDSEFLGAQPGFGLHTEMELFVELGMSPLEALRTATVTPAQVMEIADSVGMVDVGRIADLVLLDADPAADIRNTRRIAGVFVAGQFVSRETLQAQLDSLAHSYETLQSTLAAFMEALEERGAEAALAVFKSSARKAEIAKPVERVINTYGYRLLGEKRIEEAIRVFTLNTQEFPHEYNTWDSLAEAYMIAGDRELAVRYYRKVLELRPGDENATQMLKRLGVDPAN